MTACNAKPPEGHPFHDTLVACHLPEGHLPEQAHSWDIEAAVANHERLQHALAGLEALFPGRKIVRFDTLVPEPMRVYDVDPDTGERAARPYRVWDTPAGPWLEVTYEDGEQFVVWKRSGGVWRVGPDGAVEEDPIVEGME